MKKVIAMALVLSWLMMLTLLQGVGQVHANSHALQPVQIQSTGYTDSQGTITVTASCPQRYRVRSGNVQISPSSGTPPPMYSIRSNGPNTRRSAWVTTIENKTSASLSVTVTATCEAS